MKQYVVVRFTDGKYRAWADYGDIAWGSPVYEVLEYLPTYKEALAFIKQHKAA